MERQDLRVIVASEYPEVRHFLRWMVEREGQAVIVGQAQNEVTALALVRSLRPDVAVIDCQLPHVVGLDTVASSRLGGLDTAQNISADIPGTGVILLNSLDEGAFPKDGWRSDDVTFFFRDISGVNASFTLQKLYNQTMPASPLIFANVEIEQRVTLQQKTTNIDHKTFLLGTLGTLGGFFLILTMVFGGGIFLALAGAATVLLGPAGKRTASLWHRIKRETDKG